MTWPKLHKGSCAIFCSGSVKYIPYFLLKLFYEIEFYQFLPRFVIFRWTDQCIGGHDTNRRTETYEHVGQNYAMMASSVDNPADWGQFVQNWYDEVKKYVYITLTLLILFKYRA